MKKNTKLITIFIMLILLITLSPFFVNAISGKKKLADKDKNNKETTTTTTTTASPDSNACKNLMLLIDERYKLDIDYNANDKAFSISMNIPESENLGFNKDNIKFKITKAEYYDLDGETLLGTVDEGSLSSTFGINSDTTLTNGGRISFAFNNNLPTPATYTFILKPVGFTDPTVAEKCGDNYNLEIELSYDVNKGSAFYTEEEHPPVYFPGSSSGQLDCNDYRGKYSQGSFEYKFCEAKEKAYGADGSKRREYNYNNLGKNNFQELGESALKYYCDPNEFINSQEYLINESDDTQEKRDAKDKLYYTEKNTNYLIGIHEEIKDVGDYVYNFGGQDKDGNGNIVVKEDILCGIKCEEVVVVNYGPPVAGEAGFCFEYKVKVESYVNCSISINPNEFKYKTTYCTPVPGCDHGRGFVDKRSGPNDDFDTCVKKCDGGKYGKKCSKKCYSKIYGNKKTTTKSDFSSFDDIISQKVISANNVKRENCDGEGKYVQENGVIKWKTDGRHCLARWYLTAPDQGHLPSYACVKNENEGGGIAAACSCNGTCKWMGCESGTTFESGQYLNEGEASRDIKKNQQAYTNALSACESKAKCTKTEAEFTISVDYTYGDGNSTTTKKITFPYEKGNNDSKVKVTIPNDDNAAVCTPSDRASTTILKMDGCYANSDCVKETSGEIDYRVKGKAHYLTEWTFPGTWVGAKYGNISYRKPEPTSDEVWEERENRYCPPLDQKDVNEAWWSRYYMENLDGVDVSLNDDGYLNGIQECPEGTTLSLTECKRQSPNANKTFSYSDGSIKPNIHASTKSFGYFKWDINIECFYASARVIKECTPKCNPDPSDSESSEQMRIRTVDLENLFPASDGEKLTTPEETGRSPGFNWSRFAENARINEFHQRPIQYARWVQKKGYTIYDDTDELDYDITLTKENIKNIKQKQINYTDFEGRVEVSDHVVSHYSSPILRSTTEFATINKKPEETLKCNNIKGSNCFDALTG